MSEVAVVDREQPVWIVTYTNKWPEDGFELGGVYATEAAAERAGDSRACAERDWDFYSVSERTVQSAAETASDTGSDTEVDMNAYPGSDAEPWAKLEYDSRTCEAWCTECGARFSLGEHEAAHAHDQTPCDDQ